MKRSADVVIIGAGIIGCSTAYHLAKAGISDVVVLEMDQVGSGTSSKSASMLSTQFGSDLLLARMAQYNYQRYMQFEAELETSIDFRKTGWITIAAGKTGKRLQQHATNLRSLGLRTDILSPSEVKYLYPEINIDGIEVGTWDPDDGSFDPHMIMWGYIKQAAKMGVHLYQGEKAQGIRVEKGSVIGVETQRGFLATTVVINAAGPWAAEVSRWGGIEIPLTNKTRTIVMTGPLPEFPQDRPFLEDFTDEEWYIRPETGGVLMGMGTVPSKSPEAVLDTKTIDRIIDHAIHRVPALEKASLLTAWSGVRPMTVDGRPLFGRVDGLDGFLLNCGWGGMGIIQAPLAGQLMAELIISGNTSTFSCGELELHRFSSTKPIPYSL